MNKELEEKSLLLNKNIKKSKEFKDFIQAKKILESNVKLSNIISNLEKMKHVMCRCDDDNIKDEYQKALDEYNSSPLVVNYQIYKNRLDDLVYRLISIINKDL